MSETRDAANEGDTGWKRPPDLAAPPSFRDCVQGTIIDVLYAKSHSQRNAREVRPMRFSTDATRHPGGPPARQASEMGSKEWRPMSAVLIVDDSPADRALFRTILTRAATPSMRWRGRGGGGEGARGPASRDRPGREPARHGRPYGLPAIRADPEVAGVPVLMLTVRDNDTDVLDGTERRRRRLRDQGLSRRDFPRPDQPADPVSPDGDRGGPERATRPGRAAARRDRPRDSRAALGHSRQRGADEVPAQARRSPPAMARSDPAERPGAPGAARAL